MAQQPEQNDILLEVNGLKILVDCGMQQGSQEDEAWNYTDFPYNPSEIDYLFLTHAHIDNVGRVPKLVKDGFKGKIIGTGPTIDLAKVSLIDSAGIIQRESAKKELEPFFTMDDVIAAEKYYTKQNLFYR